MTGRQGQEWVPGEHPHLRGSMRRGSRRGWGDRGELRQAGVEAEATGRSLHLAVSGGSRVSSLAVGQAAAEAEGLEWMLAVRTSWRRHA